jgi:hypothetical protein
MIGTGAAIAMALLGAGQTAASVYSTKKSGAINEKALAAQRDSDTASAQLERERLAQEKTLSEEQLAAAERARQESLAWDKERYNSYIQARQPYWQAGQSVFNSLLGLANGARTPGGFSLPAPSAPHAAVGPKATLTAEQAMPAVNPNDPASIDAAIKKAAQITQGSGYNDANVDYAYWRPKFGADPEYAYHRELGWQAGPQDMPANGPYAAAGGAAGGGAAAAPASASAAAPPRSLYAMAVDPTAAAGPAQPTNRGQTIASQFLSAKPSGVPRMSLMDLVLMASGIPNAAMGASGRVA